MLPDYNDGTNGQKPRCSEDISLRCSISEIKYLNYGEKGFSQRNGFFQGNILNAMSFQHMSGYRNFNQPTDTHTQIIHWGETMISDIFVDVFAKSNRHVSNS